MTDKYIAITIGPISDTMNLVTKPAALWLSSYMFSYISKSLCIKISEKIGCENIVVPFIPSKDKENYSKLMKRNDGVGLFHDHIICKYDDELWSSLPTIKKDVIDDISGKIDADPVELEKYLMIAACKYDLNEGENPILCCSTMLDCLELPKKFNPKEKRHPVIGALSNKEAKKVADNFGIDLEAWQLIHEVTVTDKEGNPVSDANGHEVKTKAFKDIPHIASTPQTYGFKKNNYFCILRADGDNISKIISNLTDDVQCRDFSKVCLEYCDAVNSAVNEYGGITVFAGGDDLFALVPCESEKGTVFGLIRSIIGQFEEKFKNYIDEIKEKNEKVTAEERKAIPALSFGLLICHKKYPLYEAVQKSAELLFDVAKSKNQEKKNCTVVQLQKHSGQSEELLINNLALGEFDGLLADIISERSSKDTEEANTYLLSAAQKLMLFSTLIDELRDESSIKNTFENIFDAGIHIEKYKHFLHCKLPKYYIDHCINGDVVLLENNKEIKNKTSKTLGQILRLMKFFVEKGDE